MVIIPHGGVRVPGELSGYEAVTDFDLFIQSDSCANEVFNFNERVAATVKTDVSRFFIDLDRPYTALADQGDGVIKKTTLFGKPVFVDNMFPDEIAITNLLHRYYFPCHNAIQKIIDDGEIELILDCHTMLAVGPPLSPDAGKPRPLVLLEHQCLNGNKMIKTSADGMVASLLDYLNKSFLKEDGTIAQKYSIKKEASHGFILKKYGAGGIPFIRLSITRSLFLNDEFFSYDYIRVDELRIQHLKNLIWSAIEKFVNKNFV